MGLQAKQIPEKGVETEEEGSNESATDSSNELKIEEAFD